MTPLEAAWQAVLEHPDDDRALHVLADALSERGDAQGELIRLQLMPSIDEDAVLEHVAANAVALLGDARRLQEWRPVFRRGFLYRVGELIDHASLQALFAQPVARLLRQLPIGSLLEAPISRAVETIASLGPQTISHLEFGRAGRPGLHVGGLVDLERLFEALPSLTHLRIGSWGSAWEGARSASLRELDLSLEHPARELGSARLPVLDTWRMLLPFRREPLPTDVLAGEVAPQLRSLTIFGALWPEQLAELSVSALLRGLSHLEIAAEAETGWYPALLQTIDSFGHLKRIDLGADRHHPEWVETVQRALPQAIIHTDRVGGV
jgi:uncharacterized protein (TIGR02996 family)